MVTQAGREALAWSGMTAGTSRLPWISRVLEALPVAEREVIVLHLTEGFWFREIGRMTGVPLFTAAGRYRRGLAACESRSA